MIAGLSLIPRSDCATIPVFDTYLLPRLAPIVRRLKAAFVRQGSRPALHCFWVSTIDRRSPEGYHYLQTYAVQRSLLLPASATRSGTSQQLPDLASFLIPLSFSLLPALFPSVPVHTAQSFHQTGLKLADGCPSPPIIIIALRSERSIIGPYLIISLSPYLHPIFVPLSWPVANSTASFI